jgi:phosphomethylpyrimidine synthase
VREFAAKQNAGVGTLLVAEDAEAGMEEMSRMFRKGGSALYREEQGGFTA